MRHLTLALCFLLLACGVAYAKGKPKAAHSDLINAQGEKVGTAKLTPARKGVRIALDVSKLPPGEHGFHIHAVGKCDPPDFKTAGGHFNPYGKKHGLKNPEGPHAGDIRNVTASARGAAKATLIDSQVTLGEGVNSLFHADGTAIVIHANPDDGMTDPAGNAGARIACGVITR